MNLKSLHIFLLIRKPQRPSETLRGKTDRKEPKKVTGRVHRKTKGSQGEERAVVRGSKLGKAKGIKLP